MISENIIRGKISKIHSGDAQQLKVIFSDSERIIVEAPAGYGKTTTMVSRIAYLYCTGKIPNPRKVLGLTFSVNAAFKIKSDVSSKLPDLIGDKDNPIGVSDKVTVTNYHGFCKQILKKYGYLESPFLKKDLNLFRAIGKYELMKDSKIIQRLSVEANDFLIKMENKIQESTLPSQEEISRYLGIVYKLLLPYDLVTHTAIILGALRLLWKYDSVRKFYGKYYSLIVVDEFQDTNCIAWELLKVIICNNTQLLFLGDSLQRIYGFIGALPNIMSIAKDEFNMEEIALNKNYRFMNNAEMLRLDKNIRNNAKNSFGVESLENAKLPTIFRSTHEEESDAICELIKNIIDNDEKSKIALLFRGRGKDVEITQGILETLEEKYFYGMFTDDDERYIAFHFLCQTIFIKKFGTRKSITNHALESFVNEIRNEYDGTNSEEISSLLILLDAFITKVKVDYCDLLPEDKYVLLLDAFENRQLKQAMEYVDTRIILSTVHGAKGLEWDYVIIADLERWIFPSFAVCSVCDNRFNNDVERCSLPKNLSEELLNQLIEEISVFYVAVTRARKQVYVSASLERYNTNGQKKQSCISCFGALNGIQLIKAQGCLL